MSWFFRVMVGALPWYAALQALGFAAWPFLFGVFNRIPDRGYAASKAFGLVLVSYASFLLAHAPQQGFTRNSVGIGVAFLVLLSLVRLGRTYEYILEFVRLRWQLCAIYEVLFAAAFGAMVLLRSKVPQITFEISDHAAEKFTDFAVLNGLLCSRVFPPHDAWLSGFSMNYYYFGHFLWATVTRLLGCGSEIAFNLALASIFAYVVVLAFSLGYNATGAMRWGWLAAFFIAASSNLDGSLQLFGIVRSILDGDLEWRRWYMGYDYWRSSRAIEGTINEFPAFSFLLGDLHAHLSALVIFLAGLLLCLQVWKSVRRAGSLLRYELENLDELLFLALVFGALYAANSWDVVTFASCCVATFWTAATTRPDQRQGANVIANVAWSLGIAIEAVLLTGILAAVGICVLFYAYWSEFVPSNAQLARVPASLQSSPGEFFVHWILLLWGPLVLAAMLASRMWHRMAFGALPTGLTREKAIALVALAATSTILGVVSGFGLVCSLSAIVALALWGSLVAYGRPPRLRLVLAFLLVFAVLVCLTEAFYFDDIFTGRIERINTVFKIYYGLWPIAALAGVVAWSLSVRFARGATSRRAVAIGLVATVLLSGVYPIAGTFQRIGSSRGYPPPNDPARALDGMRYLAYKNPDDYAVILWIRAFTDPEARILEAPGTQYVYTGRIGTMTGRPSFGGWLYHEWGWRGDEFAAERDRRFQVAEHIYTSPSLRETVRWLESEKIDYIVVGAQERERYPNLDEKKFLALGSVAYRHGESVIYRFSLPRLKELPEKSIADKGSSAQTIAKGPDNMPAASGKTAAGFTSNTPPDSLSTETALHPVATEETSASTPVRARQALSTPPQHGIPDLYALETPSPTARATTIPLSLRSIEVPTSFPLGAETSPAVDGPSFSDKESSDRATRARGESLSGSSSQEMRAAPALSNRVTSETPRE